MAGGASDRGLYLRLLAAGLVVCASASLYWSFHDLLTVASLRRNHSAVLEMVAANPRLAPLCYISTLVVVIGLTCPGATMLSFIGGILFEQPYASVFAYVGYICGALVSYVVTSFVLGDYMRKRLADKSQLYQKFERNVRKNAFLYLVAARFTMVFPFFFVNAAAALVGVNWMTFAGASTISCVPGSVIYTTAGAALASLLHKLGDDARVDKSELIWIALSDPNVITCLVGVAIAAGIASVVVYVTGPAEKEDKAQ